MLASILFYLLGAALLSAGLCILGVIITFLAQGPTLALELLRSWIIDFNGILVGGAGYGLIGEALLERVGLGYVFKAPAGRQDSGYRPYGGVQERVRSLFRSWISAQIPAPSNVMLGG